MKTILSEYEDNINSEYEDNMMSKEDPERTKYLQKYDNIGEEDSFVDQIIDYLKCHEMQSVKSILSHMINIYDAKGVFQHEVGISIALKYRLTEMLSEKSIGIFDEDGNNFCSPLDENVWINLIRDENGIVDFLN